MQPGWLPENFFLALVGDRLDWLHHGLRRLRRHEQGALLRINGIEPSPTLGAEHLQPQKFLVREYLIVLGLERLISFLLVLRMPPV